MNAIKRYVFTSICVIAILALSLFPVPETPVGDVPFIDKWTHMAMYAGLIVCVWIDWERNKLQPKWCRSLIALLCCIALGGVIELIQPLVHRSGELLDFAADMGGAMIGFNAGQLYHLLTKDGMDKS